MPNAGCRQRAHNKMTSARPSDVVGVVRRILLVHLSVRVLDDVRLHFDCNASRLLFTTPTPSQSTKHPTMYWISVYGATEVVRQEKTKSNGGRRYVYVLSVTLLQLISDTSNRQCMHFRQRYDDSARLGRTVCTSSRSRLPSWTSCLGHHPT